MMHPCLKFLLCKKKVKKVLEMRGCRGRGGENGRKFCFIIFIQKIILLESSFLVKEVKSTFTKNMTCHQFENGGFILILGSSGCGNISDSQKDTEHEYS